MTTGLPPFLEDYMWKHRPLSDKDGYYEKGFRDAAKLCIERIRRAEMERDKVFRSIPKPRKGDWE